MKTYIYHNPQTKEIKRIIAGSLEEADLYLPFGKELDWKLLIIVK